MFWAWYQLYLARKGYRLIRNDSVLLLLLLSLSLSLFLLLLLLLLLFLFLSLTTRNSGVFFLTLQMRPKSMMYFPKGDDEYPDLFLWVALPDFVHLNSYSEFSFTYSVFRYLKFDTTLNYKPVGFLLFVFLFRPSSKTCLGI